MTRRARDPFATARAILLRELAALDAQPANDDLTPEDEAEIQQLAEQMAERMRRARRRS